MQPTPHPKPSIRKKDVYDNDPQDARFPNQQKWESHFDDHGGKLGYRTKEEFLDGAIDLIEDALNGTVPQVESGTRRNGDLVIWDGRDGSVLIWHKDGTIGTYFQPPAGYDYYEGQFGRGKKRRR